MKLSRIFLPALMLGALLCVSPSSTHAQGGLAPNQQLGLGVHTSGINFAYALSPSFHIGTDFALASVTGDGGGTTIEFGPYARLLFEGIVNPFVQIGFGVTKPGTGDAVTSLYGAGGIEYFLNQNVGAWGGVSIVTIPFQEGASTTIGFLEGRVGLEWWFQR